MPSTHISDYAARQNERLTRAEAGLQGLEGDVAQLNDTIRRLQETQGELTPEDQALLDQIEARGEALAVRVAALDAQTVAGPEVPPGVPSEPSPAQQRWQAEQSETPREGQTVKGSMQKQPNVPIQPVRKS
jgi:hypothetical protein